MRRSPRQETKVANVSVSTSTPNASSASTEQLPYSTLSEHADGRRRSPRLAEAILGLHQNVSESNASNSDRRSAGRSPPTVEILSQNAYSQPSSSLASSLTSNCVRRSLSSVINNDNYGMDLSAKNFACCFSDSDEEDGFDPFSPLFDNDDWYLDDEKDDVTDGISEIYDNVETNIINNSSVNENNIATTETDTNT